MRILPKTPACALLIVALTVAGQAVAVAALPAAPASAAQQASALGSRPAGLSARQALAQAHKTGRPVAVPSMTTATAQTTANPDGSLTLSESVFPVRARHDGGWHPLDASLVKTTSGRLTPRLSAASVSLSGGGTGPLAVMTANLRTLTLTFPGTLPAPTISGPTATYANVLPGVDLLMTATTLGGVAETLVVNSASAAASPALASLQLGVRASGLTLALSETGQLSAAAGPGAAPLITTQPVLMWDSAPPPATLTTTTGPGGAAVSAQSGLPANSSAAAPGAGAHVTAVPVSLSGSTLTLSPPASALTGAGVTYPVYIDPTYNNAVGGQASAWTQVDSGFPTTTYWKESSDLQTGLCDFSGCNGLGVARSFFQLPLGSALHHAYIGNADIYTEDQWSADGCTAQPADLYTTGSISSSTTWNAQPAWGTRVEEESFAFGSSGCGYYAKDVTWGTGSAATGGTTSTELAAVIQGDANASTMPSSQTFGLRAPDEGNDLQWKQYAYGAANITMTITYDQPPAAPASLQTAQGSPPGCQTTQSAAATIGDNDVTFTAETSDPYTSDSMTNVMDIRNPDGSQAGTPGGGNVTMTGTSGGSGITSYTFSADQMKALSTDGTTNAHTYYWQAQSTNQYGHAGPWSGLCWFTYNPVGPPTPVVTITDTSGTVTSTVPYASTFDVRIQPHLNSDGSCAAPCPASYRVQLGAGPSSTLSAQSGTVPLTMNQVGPVNVTVTPYAAGNPGAPVSPQITGAPPATPSYDGYYAGGSYPSLLTLTGSATSTPALLLSPGSGNGTLGPATDIGSLGNGTNASGDGPADWKSDIIAHGDFLAEGTNNVNGFITSAIQDILFYNPNPANSNPPNPAAGIIAGTDNTAVLPGLAADTAQLSAGLLANCNGDYPAEPNASGASPASQLVGAANASGISAGTDDLIGIAGNATSNDFELDIYTNGLSAGTALDGGYQYTATLATTSPDGNSWGDYSLATIQAGSHPGGTANPAQVTLFALDTTTGQLYQAQVSPLTSSTSGCYGYTEPSLTWTQVSTPWGAPQPTLVSADINHAGSTELWTMAGGTATAYTLSGGALTASTTANPVIPGHDWPLTDATTASAGTTPASAADLTGGDSSGLSATGASWDTRSADAYFGGDITLNGTSGYLTPAPATIPDTATTLSLSLWFKASTPDGVLASLSSQPVSAGTTSSGYDPVMYIGSDGKLNAEWYNGAVGPIVSASPFDDGLWHHAVLAASGGQQTLYIDGQTQGTATGNPDLSVVSSGPTNLTFGAGYLGNSWPDQRYNGITPAVADYFKGQLAAITLSDSQPLAAIGAEGSDGQLWVQAPQLAGGWQPEGGTIIAAPAVAAAPNPGGSTPAQPLFVATGTNNQLWIRSLTAGWQPLGPSTKNCLNGPAAVITGTGTSAVLTVACEGTDNALWYNTATVPSSGLPAFTSAWTSLGGTLSGGPAVAPVGGVLTFFVRGTNGQVFTRTTSAGYTATQWSCIGHLAAATQATTGTATFACQGTDHTLWEATNSGAGWSSAASVGGVLSDGPGIAATSQQVEIFAEGTSGTVWEYSPSGWVNLGGTTVTGGAAAAALN